ncbi:MAG: hypothetical protein EOO38_29435 [Cytophagaceae bacterium]|nr:MAG: hypothetical protein EOO38_29435 [Cytophagaceae bacterium]
MSEVIASDLQGDKTQDCQGEWESCVCRPVLSVPRYKVMLLPWADEEVYVYWGELGFIRMTMPEKRCATSQGTRKAPETHIQWCVASERLL